MGRDREARRLTTRQLREVVRMAESMKPGDTLVFKFDGCNLREVISDRKIHPESTPPPSP